jgi:hypothetical protein
MRKFTTRVSVFTLTLAAGLALTWLVLSLDFISSVDGGPMDFEPRLEASAVSPDNNLTVKVFRQRDPSYSRFRGAFVFVQVYDNQGRVLYRGEFGSDGWWSELDSGYEIGFGKGEVRVTRLWCPRCGPGPYDKIIRVSELRSDKP